MKIFVYNLREYDEKAYFDRFCKENGCEYDYTAQPPSLDTVSLARGYDAVNIITTPMDAALLECFHKLGIRYISTRTIGYDHIDINKARELGIKVANIAYSPNSVANYAIMLMLMACRNITHILKRADVQDYTLKGKLGKELSNCTVGVIGTGKIGSTVLKHLHGFGCRLLAYGTHPNQSVTQYAQYAPLEILFQQCDILTLHTPLIPDTFHMINKQSISAMKDGVILINTARGALIDTAALIEGLDQHKIGFAALDVIENERNLYYLNRMNEVIGNHDLAILSSYPNVIVTPHTAFYTEEAVSNMVENSIKSLCDWEQGRENPFEIK
ncbi:MAG: alpha-keto acid dehydrogenase [Oscillospiraceae bacterium]|nr:alpha-keto acid dehydrogenase [Oscillospiraceae bacterium]